jgi:multidrug efflux pump
VFFVVVMRLFRRKAVAEGEAAEARTRHEPARVAAE